MYLRDGIIVYSNVVEAPVIHEAMSNTRWHKIESGRWTVVRHDYMVQLGLL
jgi:hypothetical protein